MFHLLLLFQIAELYIRCQMQQLYENFNSQYITNLDDWKCKNSFKPQVYKCKSGMDLIRVDKLCEKITSEIQHILPHYQVQIYIDVYCYGGLDPDDYLAITIDAQNIWQTETSYLPKNQQPLGISHQCKDFAHDKNYQIRKTVYKEISHSSEILKIELQSTISGEFQDESYLFRNLQILYKECYKTCKTCVQESKDRCSLCYDNIHLISGTCMSCQDQINLTFLQVSKGCVIQCPDEHDYDLDKVCYKNEKLKSYVDSDLIKSQEGYKISGNLDTSAILLRITITIEIMNTNFFNVLLNGVQIASISRYRIRQEPGSKSNYLSRINNEIMVEINKPISVNNFNIEIVKFQHLSKIPTFKVQYLVCALKCQVCKNNKTCKVCKDNYYFYNGLCFTSCPDYTVSQDKLCVIPNEIVDQIEDKQEIFLVKEFYDLSTSKKRIDELFTLVSLESSAIKQYNFQKGDDIYFSYFQNRRIFGGPYVWVNAQFKFHLDLENIQQTVYVKFQLILGDQYLSRSQFHYTINSKPKVTLRINNNQNLKEDQNWDDQYVTDIISVREKVEYSDGDIKQLNIIFHCDNNFNNANSTFCGIKDMFISVLKPIQDDIDQFEQNQIKSAVMEDLISICGDGITSEDEDCDDGNLIPFDGCFNCKYSCEELCQFCVKGECLLMLELQSNQILIYYSNIIDMPPELHLEQFINCENLVQGLCLQCNYGYYMNYINNLCESICGDSIIQGLEQCDDGNVDNYDGCSNCQLIQYENCEMLQTCAVCYYGKCIKCNDGFTLEIDRCISICGDALINQQEECDNPNQQGCSDCQIQKGYVCHGPSYSICKTCGMQCKECQSINQLDLICIDCMSGFYSVLDQCLQCDINCITCQDQSNLCTSCYRNDCELCESIPGYYTDFQNKICITKCGDGIVAQEEEDCDDGNLEDADGCDSQCRIELSEDFIDNLQIWQLNSNNAYDLYLNKSQYKLVLNCQDPIITIEGMQTTDFIYNISAQNNICTIQFQFFKSIFKYNTIYIQLTFSFEKNRLLLDENIQTINFKIQPNEQILMDEKQKQLAQQISNAQTTFNFIFLILIPVSIILHLYDYLWAILEILSWVNNFYFLNVRYPFNVEMFFLNSDWSSFVTFPTYQGLNQPDCSYYFQAPQKFQNKGIDPLFFNNIQIPFMFIFITFLLYKINFLILQFFNTINQYKNKNHIQNNHKHFSIFNLQVIKKAQNSFVQQPQTKNYIQNNSLLHQIINGLIIMDKELKNKLKQTLSLCLLDITLAIMLQITFSNKKQHIIVDLNQFFAVISVSIILFQIYQQYKTLNLHTLLAENKQYKEQFQVYYENVNTKESFGYYFKFFGLIRKILYIYFMVYYYNIPIVQTSLCFISTSVGVMFILYKNPYNTKKEFYQQLITELSLSLILLIAVIFSINDTKEIAFMKQIKVNLGWAIISFVLLAILVQLFGLTYEFIVNIYQAILKMQNYFQNLNKNKIEQYDNKILENTDSQNAQEKQVNPYSQLIYEIIFNYSIQFQISNSAFKLLLNEFYFKFFQK
ncbi:unnamed protein product [Paramecium octaurelia]|uniref:Uncharacterized protein n=1 Tax=Paramecium octaurelia TaxID=43137 RepID=A0A8S1WHF2_PAROT|nr:unnamed protein product [Paramecium octaurelia]